jgi:anaerobic selenocysteine-containing dehydrogenase
MNEQIIETDKRGTCPICGIGCITSSNVEDGEVVKVKPDRDSFIPASCPRAGQSLPYHNHPDRINYPMKRVGKRGEGKWEKISWDQAMDEIAAKLSDIRDEYGPEAVQTLNGSYNGWITYGEIGPPAGWPIVGVTEVAVFWGFNPPVPQGVTAEKLIKEAQEKGTKIIAIDSRRSEIAEIADLWLQPRPASDGALAYGMLNIIIEEELYDKEFVENWTIGFDELKELVKPYTLEKVSELTWIPEDKILEAARSYATLKPGLMTFGLGTAHHGRASNAAVFGKHYLRAICGNLDVPGGEMFDNQPTNIAYREEMHWDKLIDHPLRTRDNINAHRWPAASVRGMKALRKAMEKVHPLGVGPAFYHMCTSSTSLCSAILDQDPYPIKAVITQGTNSLVALANSKRVYEALKSENLELSVNMDHWMTPNAQLADYVLPASDGFERANLGAGGGMWGFGDFMMAAKSTIEPQYERKDDYQLWADLGKRLGQEEYWPETAEGWFDQLLKPSGMSFNELAEQPGGALFPTAASKRYETLGFATESGKVELSSNLMKKLGYPGMPEREEPIWSPISTPELFEDFPLVVTAGASTKWYYRSQQRQLPKMRKQHPYAFVSIHPDTAKELGLEDNTPVFVETPMGRVKQITKFDDTLHPKVVHADSSWWYPEQEMNEPNLSGVWESNFNAIIPDSPESLSYAGDSNLRGHICRVVPINEPIAE